MIFLIFLILSLIATGVSIFLIPSASYFYVPIIVFPCTFLALVVLLFVYLFILGLFVNMKKDYRTQNKLYNATVIYVMQWILMVFRVKVKCDGLEIVPHDQKYMLVYNHTSNFDPIVLSWILRKDNLIHISKPENFKKPFAGRIVYRNCYIPIDRENNRNALKAVFKACDLLEENKYSIGVSPEGTRNKGNVNEMLPFRDGCFKIALRSKCPIVIVELDNAEKIKKFRLFKSNIVNMNVLDVLYNDDYKDLKTLEISQIVREKIQSKIDEREK